MTRASVDSLLLVAPFTRAPAAALESRVLRSMCVSFLVFRPKSRNRRSAAGFQSPGCFCGSDPSAVFAYHLSLQHLSVLRPKKRRTCAARVPLYSPSSLLSVPSVSFSFLFFPSDAFRCLDVRRTGAQRTLPVSPRSPSLEALAVAAALHSCARRSLSPLAPLRVRVVCPCVVQGS